MVLTEKEMATIEDLHTQELSCVEKYKRYGQEAKDPVLRDLFADLEKKEQKHVESLEQVMKGSDKLYDGYCIHFRPNKESKIYFVRRRI